MDRGKEELLQLIRQEGAQLGRLPKPSDMDCADDIFIQFGSWKNALSEAGYIGFHVLFKNAATLSTELCEARDSYSLRKLERILNSADLLTLHELSYLSFNRHQSELLKVISARSEPRSTIVTTNPALFKMDRAF